MTGGENDDEEGRGFREADILVTANLSADILSFARSKGLYGGISLDGAVVAVRGDWNEMYYGQKITPSGVLILGSSANPQSKELTEVVRKATGKK